MAINPTDPEGDLRGRGFREAREQIEDLDKRENLLAEEKGAFLADEYESDKERETFPPEMEIEMEKSRQAEFTPEAYETAATSLEHAVYITPEEQLEDDLVLTRQYQGYSDQTGYGLSPMDRLDEYPPDERLTEELQLENEYRKEQGLPLLDIEIPQSEHNKHRPPATPQELELEHELEAREDAIEFTAEVEDRTLARDLDKPPTAPGT